VIRFGGRFVQPTKRGLCPVAEKANFQKSESDQPVARFDGENFSLNRFHPTPFRDEQRGGFGRFAQ
jgi:hypothetical protein